jgi:hypothetical protein
LGLAFDNLLSMASRRIVAWHEHLTMI